MTALIYLVSVYVLFTFVRAIYRLASGFFFTPTKKVTTWRKTYVPKVSVLIPAWNEEVGIEKTIQSVLDSSYKRIEILVINDGSKDGTKKIVSRIARKTPKVRLLNQKNTGKYGALNNGILHAKGSLILTIDADSIIETDSIKELVRVLADDYYSVAIGEVVVGNTKNWLGKAQHYEYSVGFHVKRAQHVFNSAYIFPGALTMFRKKLFNEVGLYTGDTCTEDLDISMRIKKGGHKITYVDSALCVTEGATTLKGLVNQRARWRHGYFQSLIKHKDFMFSDKKGKYLTYFDFPMQLIGVIEILLFPVIFTVLSYFLITNGNIIAISMAYFLVPITLLMLGSMRKDYKEVNLWVFAMPFMLIAIEIVEFIALNKAIYRSIRKRETTWTVWNRTGATT